MHRWELSPKGLSRGTGNTLARLRSRAAGLPPATAGRRERKKRLFRTRNWSRVSVKSGGTAADAEPACPGVPACRVPARGSGVAETPAALRTVGHGLSRRSESRLSHGVEGSRRSFKSAAPLRMSFLSCSWREGPGQQHGTGSKGGERPFRFAILTRNLCSQFVVSPAASPPARNLPDGPVANPVLHARKSHPCETPEQRRAVSLRCFTKTQGLPKQQLWLSLVLKAERLLKPDPLFVNMCVLSHRTRSWSKLSLMYWHTHRTISSTQHRSPKRCSHDHL